MRTSRRLTPAPATPLPPVLTFMRLLWLIDHGLQRFSKRMRLDLGVTGPQRLAVRVIGRAPGISAGELASTLHLDPSTVTGIVARLVQSGLVTRETHSRDRRRVVLALTAAGSRLDRHSAGTAEGVVRAVLEDIPESERRVAERLLERLADQLTNPESPAVRRRRARPRSSP